jgi:hypothetical protein
MTMTTVSIRLAALALGLFPLTTQAQGTDPATIAEERAAIAKFAWMDGMWRGTAVTQTPGGERRVTQTERIGSILDGTVKVIEGKGFNPDGGIGFNALGIISFDPATKSYAFRSYAQGRVGTFTIVPAGTGYVWEIPVGPATIRYAATVDHGVWVEVGDRIVAGRPPQRFFEMRLTRIRDTDWPAAGGLGAK